VDNYLIVLRVSMLDFLLVHLSVNAMIWEVNEEVFLMCASCRRCRWHDRDKKKVCRFCGNKDKWRMIPIWIVGDENGNAVNGTR
jgi:hypothetical protein